MDYIALPKIEVRTTYYTAYEPQEMPFRKPSGIYLEVQNFPLPFLLFSRSLLADNYLALVQLHAHLSGSISRQCLHEVWLMKKGAGETDLADPLVEMPDGKHDYNLKTYVDRY